jgi:hypothetical protein
MTERSEGARRLSLAHDGHIGWQHTKLPYAGISRIRFEGYVSTVAHWPRYPRFGRH